MAMFIVLGKLTDEGARDIRNLRKGVEANMARAGHLGVKLHGWYLTQGRYDIVVVAEAPDAETMLAQAAGVAGSGITRTETLQAWTLDEVDGILGKLGPA